MTNSTPALTFLMLLSGFFLTGCDQKQPSSGVPTQTAVKTYQSATTLHGTVSDDAGYVENGVVNVETVEGKIIASTTLQNSKNYSVEVPANTQLPIVLSYAQKQGEKIITVVVHPSITKYDLNPRTTSIAKTAMSLGGYTESNLRQAADGVIAAPDRDKTTAGFRGDPTQHYGGWH